MLANKEKRILRIVNISKSTEQPTNHRQLHSVTKQRPAPKWL